MRKREKEGGREGKNKERNVYKEMMFQIPNCFKKFLKKLHARSFSAYYKSRK